MRQVPANVLPGSAAPELDGDHLSINEVYASIQGEGRHMGRPTTFVRTSHCPLRCTWCDSKYTFNDGTPWTLDDLVSKCKELGPRNVCLTGGEPLAQQQAFGLVERLAQAGHTVEVETSGSIDVSAFNRLDAAVRDSVCINLDIKCPMSAMTHHNRWDNLAQLRPHDQLKFVVGDRQDFDYAVDVLHKHRTPCPVYVNPVWGVVKPESVAGWIASSGLDVHAGVQLHKLLWGERRGV